jgi:hypothetical protein
MPDPKPLDVTERYGEAASVSFTDGLNGQTTYFYHVQLKGLKPGTRYYYQVSDGAHAPATAGAAFETAPHGRAKFRFSGYGDLATPSWDLNTSGNIWHESSDNSWYAVTAIENPGGGKGAPLFHLLNGDLCYANLDVDNAPGVWRDFGNNVARSAANRPWMPALGNHECEFGVDTMHGKPGHAAGGVAAQGAAGNTAEGTVYLVLGGGGTNGPTNTYGTDAADDKPQAKVITTRNAIVGSEAGTAHDGTTTLPSVPAEKFAFGRKVGKK